MSWRIPRASLGGFITYVLIAGVVYAALRGIGFYNFTAREVEGLNVVLQLIGDIYAVLLAFAIFVIWGQFVDVENCVVREGNSLDDLLRFSAYLNNNTRADIRRAVAAYVNRVLQYEWSALGKGEKDEQTEQAFTHVLTTVIEAVPASDAERSLMPGLIEMARKTSGHRDERLAKCLTRIPPTLASLVHTVAGVILLIIFVYPFHHWLAGISCFVLVSLVLFLADLVMMDMDNPLDGIWNVSPQPFADLRP